MKIPRCLLIGLIGSMLALPAAALAQDTPTKTPPAQAAEAKPHTEVKGYVLPIIAGIESAQMAAAALGQLATMETLARKDVRTTAELAEQAIRIAQERTEDMRKVKGLSAEARPEADALLNKLKTARASVKKIQRQVSGSGKLRPNYAGGLRNEAAQLHTTLADAHESIEKLAGMYDVSTSLTMPQGAPATHDQE